MRPEQTSWKDLALPTVGRESEWQPSPMSPRAGHHTKWAPYKNELFDVEYKCDDDDTPSVRCKERVIDYGYWRISIIK